jgi:hypothetical protein
MLELRCSVEASNCLAFDGVVFRGCCLRVSSTHAAMSATSDAACRKHSIQQHVCPTVLQEGLNRYWRFILGHTVALTLLNQPNMFV